MNARARRRTRRKCQSDSRWMCRRGLNPHECLTDVLAELARLPSIKITEIGELLPGQ